MREHYDIPSTFDGEIPEFAFGETLPPRFRIGEWYSIPDKEGNQILGRLCDAVVMESERKVYGVYQTQTGANMIATAPLTEVELTAWHRHPETFFGQLRYVSKGCKSYVDWCDFFYDSYKNTPKDRLLELLKGAVDIEVLKSLEQRELAILYSERCAASVHNQAAA